MTLELFLFRYGLMYLLKVQLKVKVSISQIYDCEYKIPDPYIISELDSAEVSIIPEAHEDRPH